MLLFRAVHRSPPTAVQGKLRFRSADQPQRVVCERRAREEDDHVGERREEDCGRLPCDHGDSCK